MQTRSELHVLAELVPEAECVRQQTSQLADAIGMAAKGVLAKFRCDRETLQRIERGLAHSGAAERRWAADGERPIDFITRAVHGALRKAQVTPDEVERLLAMDTELNAQGMGIWLDKEAA